MASDALSFSSFEFDILYHRSSLSLFFIIIFFLSFPPCSLNVAESNIFGRKQDIAGRPYLCVSSVIEFPYLLERIKMLCTGVSNNSHFEVEASVLGSDFQPVQVTVKNDADSQPHPSCP